MRAPAKYLFDSDFAAAKTGKPTVALAEHGKAVEAADAAGYARGVTSAEAAARTEAERRTAAALERVAGAIEGLAQGLDAVAARLEAEAVEVAVAVTRKLVPELLAREPLAEIAALASECFRHLVATPHVVVRVNDSLQVAAREKLDKIVRSRGLESRLVVLAERDIEPGDCRIEWADGGITRDAAATAAAIDDAVARYVSARLETAPLPNGSWRSDP